ncbi:MAG: acyl-ACP--UDP-N-acetylglucosamine O-acyltransferase, partial [Gammaproteobacteria bacterium]|nr:acyl-ACP--UDP-N-acetylglucosamine O-acyltransferase [Gammaproteobacteria bacterium]
ENKIFQFASIGEDSQAKKYHGEKTWLEIGDQNVFREFCTINRGNAQDEGITKIGNDNLFMAYVHVAHDCQIANHTVFANNASLAGHVRVDDYVLLSGFSGVHQFCHLFPHSFLASNALVVRDVPPYIRVAGIYAKPFGLNTVGLTRHGFSAETLLNLKRAYRIIYRQNLTTEEALKELPSLLEACPEVQLFIDALKNSERGIVR